MLLIFGARKLDLKLFNFIKNTMSGARGSRKRPAKEAASENGESEPKKLMNSVESDYDGVEDIKGKFNLKIMNFNVAGLRACVKKDCVAYLEKEDADIICLNVSFKSKLFLNFCSLDVGY
jgi:hypothetical protein